MWVESWASRRSTHQEIICLSYTWPPSGTDFPVQSKARNPCSQIKSIPDSKSIFPPGFTSDSHVTLLHVMFQILTKLKYEAHKFHFIFCTKPLIQTPKILAKSTVEALVDYVKGGKTEQKSCLHGFSLEAISGAKINLNLGWTPLQLALKESFVTQTLWWQEDH